MFFLFDLLKKKSILTITMISIFLLITYHIIINQSNFLKRCSSCIVYPVLVVYHICLDPLKKKLQYFDDINALQNMLETVQQKYDEVMAENIALQAVNAYAQETEELRIYKQRYASFFIHTTQILARHFSDLAHYFLVEGGEKNGITIDMVAVYKNCLIGRVIEVYPWYSKVQLITDRLCKIAAMCTETLSVGIHEGTNQETTRLRYVSHLSHITVNDLVLSSGQGLIFPKGFGLGRVVSYKVDGLHTEVVVQPTINLHQICYCTIISKSNM